MSYRRKFPGIYRLTHLPSGHFYIGKSTDVTGRWKSHLSSFFSGKHSQRMQELWNASHYSEWSFQIVKLCKVKELPQMEKHYISASAEENPDKLLNVRDRKSAGERIFNNMIDADRAKISDMTREAMFGPTGLSIETQVSFGGEDEQ